MNGTPHTVGNEIAKLERQTYLHFFARHIFPSFVIHYQFFLFLFFFLHIIQTSRFSYRFRPTLRRCQREMTVGNKS